MEIKEYTIIEREGHTKPFYSIKLGENMYYKTYEEDGIKVTNDMEFASRIATEKFAKENIEFLKRFYTKQGKRK